MKTYNKIKYYISKIRAENDQYSDTSIASSEDEELYNKIKYILDECEPRPISSDVIWRETAKKAGLKKRKKTKVLILKASFIAASLLVLFFIGYHYLFNSHKNESPDFSLIAMEDSLTYDEVTLILPDKQISVSDDVIVTYSKQGAISVNKAQIKEESQSDSKMDVDQEDYDRIVVPKGKRTQLVLSDGTKLWLNSGSKAIYPRVFKGQERNVYIEGEAFFDVVKDATKTFTIKTVGFDVEVLGTRFNLSAYKNETTASLVLVQGEVMLTDLNKMKTFVNPNELIILKGSVVHSRDTVDVTEYISWVDGYFLVKGDLLPDVIDRLALYYGKEIFLDPSLTDEKIYGKLELKDSLIGLLQSLPLSKSFRVEERGEAIYISFEE